MIRAGAALVAGLLLLPGLTAAQASAPAPSAPPPAPPPSPSPAASATPAASPAPAANPAPSPAASPAPAASPTPPPAASPSPAASPTPPAPLPAQPRAERITFEILFPAERGGGKATGSAGAIEYQREDFALATGEVEIKYQDYDIKADILTIDVARKLVHAQGHVLIDQGPRRLSGDTADFDLETKTGKVMNASAQMDPDYYFKGREIDKVGENTYTVEDGVFTACTGKTPDWSFHMRRARVELDGYAHIYNASMRVKKLPVLYWPYILWPALRDRASGLLVPSIGFSKTRGAYAGLAYYQVLGRSYDTTIFTDVYSRSYYGVGDEFRYAPSDDTHGLFRGFAIRDPQLDKRRWKLEWQNETNNLPGGMRLVVDYLNYSDFDYVRDFERGLQQSTLRTLYSDAFLTGNWGAQSVNLLVDDRQTFFTPTSIIDLRKMPELQYRVRPLELGKTPLYFDMLSSADYLSIDRGGAYQGRYSRVDLQPELSLPLSTIPWLSLSINGGGRLTSYGSSVELPAIGGPPTLTGGNLTLHYPTGGAQIVGPSFSRIFDTSGYKLKHVIEPRWTYTYSGSVSESDQRAIPIFDNLDQIGPTNTGSNTVTNSGASALNTGTFTLTNRLLAKPKDPNSETGAQEILAVDLLESYSFDKNQPLQFDAAGTPVQRGPLIGRVRFSPGERANLRVQVNYDTVFRSIASTQLSGDLRFGPSSAGLLWFASKNAQTGETSNNQAGVYSTLQVVPNRLRFEFRVNYDVQQHILQQDRAVLTYTGQCWGFRLEYNEFKAIDRLQKDWRFALTLKNVGTFLDIGGGSNQVQ